MNLFHDLLEKIINLTQFEVSGEILDFQPIPFEHNIRFCYRDLPKELLELDFFSRNYHFLLEFMEHTSIEFELDEKGEFAFFKKLNKKEQFIYNAIIDLRDNDLILIYFLGDKKNSLKLNQGINSFSYLRECYLNQSMMYYLADSFKMINSFGYDFNLLNNLNEPEHVVKGNCRGKEALKLFYYYKEELSDFFNIESLGINFSLDKKDNLQIQNKGQVFFETDNFENVMLVMEKLYHLFKERLDKLKRKIINLNHETSLDGLVLLNLNTVVLEIVNPLKNVEWFISEIINGKTLLKVIGNYVRSTRKLWRVSLTFLDFGDQIEFEISEKMIIFYLYDINNIWAFERVLYFVRKHLCASYQSQLG